MLISSTLTHTSECHTSVWTPLNCACVEVGYRLPLFKPYPPCAPKNLQYSSNYSEWVTVMANKKTSVTPCQEDQNFNAVENRHLTVWKFEMSLLIVYNGLRVTHNSLTNTGSNIYHLSQVRIALFTFVSFPNGRVKTEYRLMCKRKSKVSKGHLILLQ